MAPARTLGARSAGLGLRRALIGSLQDAGPEAFDFLECAPDNWIGVGGRFGAALAELAERWPLVCHGLSMSLGGTAPLDDTYLQRVRRFLDAHRVPVFSEHLSYCTDDGQLYNLDDPTQAMLMVGEALSMRPLTARERRKRVSGLEKSSRRRPPAAR